MTSNLPPVSQILTRQGVPHTVYVHKKPLRSLEQAAEERGQLPEQIVRSILFRITSGEYVMVLMAGPDQVDWKILRKNLSTNRLRMATKEEVFDVTGYRLGAVAPLGLKLPINIYVDKSVFDQDIISIGSGVRGTAVILKSIDLFQVLDNYKIGSFK
jgi:Cys-tRNA(Pro)/Cys-tRNA(Cys) deacylase